MLTTKQNNYKNFSPSERFNSSPIFVDARYTFKILSNSNRKIKLTVLIF